MDHARLKTHALALTALALAFVCYTASWISGAIAFGVLGMIFEGAFWYSLLSADSHDDDDRPNGPSSEPLQGRATCGECRRIGS